jgi:hypothetical protein
MINKFETFFEIGIVLEENTLSCQFVYHKFHITSPGIEPEPPKLKKLASV